MLAFATLVAGSFSLGQVIAQEMDPYALTTLRFSVGACVMTIAALLTTPIKRAYLAAPWRYFAMGACMALYFAMMFVGLETATAVSTSALFTLTPLISAAFGWLLMRQVTSPRIALALAVGATGALWVIFKGDLSAFLSLDIGRGEAIFFIGVIGHALYTPLVPFLNRSEPVVVFTGGMLIAGALLLWIIAGQDLLAVDWSAFSPFEWFILAYLCFATTATTFFLVQFAAMRLPAAKVMAYTYFTPSVVIAWDVTLGAALPPAQLLVGVALTITALVLLLRD